MTEPDPIESTSALVVAGDELVVHVEQLPLDRRPDLVYLASLSTEAGRRAQRHALEVIAVALCPASADVIPWHRLRYQHTQAVRARLVARFAPATANRALAALRGVLREARRLGLMSAEDCAAACDLRPAKGHRVPAGRALAGDELGALVGACDRTTCAGARDAAIVEVLYGCGLRRSELVALDLEHFDPHESTLRVLGKGDRERLAYLAVARASLDAWLRLRGPSASRALFLPVDRLDRVLPRRLSDQAVLFILRRLAGRAGVDSFSPHDVRRTFISDLLDRGADISTAQGLAGHAQVTTTQRYDRRGERARRAAAGLLSIKPAKKPKRENDG